MFYLQYLFDYLHVFTVSPNWHHSAINTLNIVYFKNAIVVVRHDKRQIIQSTTRGRRSKDQWLHQPIY